VGKRYELIEPAEISTGHAPMTMDKNHIDQRVYDTRDRLQTGAEISPAWIDSRSILAGRNEVLIRHGDQTYRLRITKLGKLILHK